mmetsp:Transcript_47074/g.118581  ORF Transcript_47074/g.118581 Transcript_47074/m.118581 type:complete len:231 (-) Transcript_47074:141-833(-)
MFWRQKLFPSVCSWRSQIEESLCSHNGQQPRGEGFIQRGQHQQTTGSDQLTTATEKPGHIIHVFKHLHTGNHIEGLLLRTFFQEHLCSSISILEVGECGIHSCVRSCHLDHLWRCIKTGHRTGSQSRQGLRKKTTSTANVKDVEILQWLATRSLWRAAAFRRTHVELFPLSDRTKKVGNSRWIQLVECNHGTFRIPPPRRESSKPGDFFSNHGTTSSTTRRYSRGVSAIR